MRKHGVHGHGLAGMRSQHGPQKLLQLRAGSILRSGDAHNGLYNMAAKVQLRGQRALLHHAMRQRAHALQEGGAEHAVYRHPQHAGLLGGRYGNAARSGRQHAAVAPAQRIGHFVVFQLNQAVFHGKPQPAFSIAHVIYTGRQHSRARRGNPHAAGTRQLVGIVHALHIQGLAQLILLHRNQKHRLRHDLSLQFPRVTADILHPIFYNVNIGLYFDIKFFLYFFRPGKTVFHKKMWYRRQKRPDLDLQKFARRFMDKGCILWYYRKLKYSAWRNRCERVFCGPSGTAAGHRAQARPIYRGRNERGVQALLRRRRYLCLLLS